MMNRLLLFPMLLLTMLFYGCSEDEPVLMEVSASRIVDLHAPQEGSQGEPVSGEFIKFNFATGAITQSETEWDIAFRGTSIIVNGGLATGTEMEPNRTGMAAAYIDEGTLNTVMEIHIRH